MSPANLLAVLLGQHLNTLRKKMELKQSAFAHLMGTSDETLSEIEKGRKLPSLKMLCELSEQLEMTLSELVDFQDAPKTDSAAGKQLNSLNLYLKTNTASAKEITMVKETARVFIDTGRSIYEKPRRRPYGTSSGRKPFILRDK